MTPIHEMKTRKATWVETGAYYPRTDLLCHGVFFEADGREVGVVIRDQPEAVAKPLIEAIAALPMIAGALLGQGYGEASGWHTQICHELNANTCSGDCTAARAALKILGALP